MRIELAPHRTPAYEQTVQLRREVLRWPLGLEFTEEQLAAESTDVHLGAFDDGRCVGCLVLTPIGDDTYKMRQVAVSPNRQGTGVGRAMVEWSEEYARLQGRPWIKLNARDTAVPFYERLGYAIEGEPFEEVGIPHRAMRRRVPL